MKRKSVVYVKLQGTDAFFPGVGSFGTTIDITGKVIIPQKLQGLKMYDDGDKLVLDLRGYEIFIPMTNVQIGVYGEDQETVKPLKAAS